VVGLHVVHLGRARQVQLDLGDQLVELVDECQIERGTDLHGRVGEAVGDVEGGAVGGVAELLAEGGQVVLGVEDLQVGNQFGALVDEVQAAPQEVAGFTHALGVGIGEREVAALEQVRDLAGVDTVVLGLGAVDELHVQGVADDEGEAVLGAAVGEPVPAEHALDTDDDAVAEGSDGLEQGVEVAGEVLVEDDVAGVVEDADVHGPGVQVDAAVESVLGGVEAHHGLLGWVGA
jgi:hypothetical protein